MWFQYFWSSFDGNEAFLNAVRGPFFWALSQIHATMEPFAGHLAAQIVFVLNYAAASMAEYHSVGRFPQFGDPLIR